MPTNLYGPGDNYTADSHVLGAHRRFHQAVQGMPERDLLGSGSPRGFLHVDDLGEADVRVGRGRWQHAPKCVW